MKRIIMLNVLLLSSIVSFSQCKFKQNEVDDFTKSKIIKTIPRVLANDMSGSVVLQFISENQYFIDITVSFKYHDAIVTSATDEILFLMNDKSVMTFPINNIFIGQLKGSGNLMSSTEFQLKFPITLDQLNSIKELGVDKVRFEAGRLKKDFIVKNRKDVEKINHNISCLINESQK